LSIILRNPNSKKKKKKRKMNKASFNMRNTVIWLKESINDIIADITIEIKT